jgi:hypothetical protein
MSTFRTMVLAAAAAACSHTAKPAPVEHVDNAQPAQLPAATEASATPLPDPGDCDHDTDCVVSDFGGCCGACPARAYATSKKDLETQTAVCAVVTCSAPSGVCPRVEPTSHFAAACHGLTQDHRGRCTLVPVTPPTGVARCQHDSDCVVSNRGDCCEPCPTKPYAVLKGHEHGIACVTDCSVAARPPCATVESPALYRATCGGGACALVHR